MSKSKRKRKSLEPQTPKSADENIEIEPASLFARSKNYIANHLLLVGVIALVSIGAIGAGLKYLEEDAQRQLALKPHNRSSLSRFNPFVPMPTPTPTPQLSKEYVYAGSRLLAVEDANASAVPPADLAVWRPSNGTWYVLGGVEGSQQVTEGWGLSGDKPVAGDYDGDGKTDFSVFRPTDNKWYIKYSSTGSTWDGQFGLTGDLPAQADFDGDGKTDKAVLRYDDPNSGDAKWYISLSSNGSTYSQAWGLEYDKPAPADYDGDGKADLAVWRPSNETFYVQYSSNNVQTSFAFDSGNTLTLADAEVVSSDYDGDGKADFAVYDDVVSPYTKWYVRSSISGSIATTTFGIPTDMPVHNDYDADGKTDIAIWRPTNSSGNTDAGHWFILQSATSSVREEAWGLTNDIPVPAYFRR